MALSFSPDFQGYGNQTTSPGTLTAPAGSIGDTIACMVMTADTAVVAVSGFTLLATQVADGHKLWVFLLENRDGTETTISVIVTGTADHCAAAGNFPFPVYSVDADNISAVVSPFNYSLPLSLPTLFAVHLDGDNGGTITGDPDLIGFNVNFGLAGNPGDMTYYAADTAGIYPVAKGTAPSELSGLITVQFDDPPLSTSGIGGWVTSWS